jgi:hypothetical protein
VTSVRGHWEQLSQRVQRLILISTAIVTTAAAGTVLWNGSRAIAILSWRWTMREFLVSIEAGREADIQGAVRDSILMERVTQIGARQKTESDLILRALEATPGSRPYRDAVRRLRALQYN